MPTGAKIVDLDEIEKGYSDLIDVSTQDEDEEINITFLEIPHAQLGQLCRIDEHPLNEESDDEAEIFP